MTDTVPPPPASARVARITSITLQVLGGLTAVALAALGLWRILRGQA